MTVLATTIQGQARAAMMSVWVTSNAGPGMFRSKYEPEARLFAAELKVLFDSLGHDTDIAESLECTSYGRLGG